MKKSKVDPAIERDGCCVVGGSMILLAPHHVIRKGAGGSDDESNKVTLCLEHHGQTEQGYLVVGHCVSIGEARDKGYQILYHRDEIDGHLRGLIPTMESIEIRDPMLEMIQ